MLKQTDVSLHILGNSYDQMTFWGVCVNVYADRELLVMIHFGISFVLLPQHLLTALIYVTVKRG